MIFRNDAKHCSTRLISETTSEDHHDIIVLIQDSFAAVCERESEREDRDELPHLIKHLRVEKKADRTERESYG